MRGLPAPGEEDLSPRDAIVKGEQTTATRSSFLLAIVQAPWDDQNDMSAEEAQKEIAALRNAGKAIRKSPASARKFLIKHKILTPKGDLAKRFRR